MKSEDGVVFPKGLKALQTWKLRLGGWFFALFALVAATLPARLALAQAPPPNDNFANAISILGTNVTVIGTNDYATKEPGEPDHAGNIGGKSVWWTWQAPSNAFVTISPAQRQVHVVRQKPNSYQYLAWWQLETQQQAEETKGHSRPEQPAGVQANTQTFADDSIACGLGIINKPQTQKENV